MPDRISPRADFHDYSCGDYFVTVCTDNMEHFFGEINDDKMQLSVIGCYCQKQLLELTEHYKYVEIPLFVVMPNHVHAILRVIDLHDTVGPPVMRTALSVIIGGFKRAVTMYARRNNIPFKWQSRYHDHIIRGAIDGNNIANYIETNVIRWSSDCFHPSKRPK